jgi:Na+/proline symporter/signal transduction histidine kinase/CheY-like chemotaxis protein
LLTPSILIVTIIAYIALLFWVAKRGDQDRFKKGGWSRHPLVYALALGVYCTSWTFYGLVGTASISTWKFIPILMGPVLMFTLGAPLMKRIFHICRQEHIHSIADFIASRYGKRQGIAASVTLVVLLATVPYISLQLKAVSDSLSLLIGGHIIGHQDLTLLIAGAMTMFALMFGAKQLDVSRYHGGLTSAIAFESVIKLLAMIFIAGFAAYWIFSDPARIQTWQSSHLESAPVRLNLRFFVEIGLSACAIFCLPRMFHVGFVECLSDKHLKTGQRIFPLYLILIGVCIYIIAQAGNQMFFSGAVAADTYVIAIPLALNSPTLTLIAFLGGFSAATAMIIVSTITLSQMLSNDVILPLIIRRQKHNHQTRDYTKSLILTRRLTVAVVILFAYFYQAALAENAALTSMGLIAFALSVHLAPPILLGLYTRHVNAIGMYVGLGLGVSCWAYMLMPPLLAKAGLFELQNLENGPFGIRWLSPIYFLGAEFGDHFTRSVILSLSINCLGIWLFSKLFTSGLADRIQAAAFTSLEKFGPELESVREDIYTNDLKELLRQFAGPTITDKLFANSSGLANTKLIEKTQRALSGIVGVASSQSMIDSLRSGKKLAVEDVVNLFGETTRALRFNQEILFSSFENVSSGISVVNAELNIVAWNQRYEKMFNYPEGMLQVGQSVADLVRFNAGRGLLGAGAIDKLVESRLTHLQEGKPYRVVRQHHDDHVIEIKGTPLPDGGYVTTYDDITDFIATQKQLEQSNINLEQRVLQRTGEIQAINEDLRSEIELRKEMEKELLQAKAQAETANATKSRFLALASHDILQPINAAQLYLNSLLEHNQERRDQSTLVQIKDAVTSAEVIISSLLEIARLDTKAMKPDIQSFPIASLLDSLVCEYSVLLEPNVSIHYVKSNVAVRSDPSYLRRILQNFISNAVKYTESGRILIGCRREGQNLRICVYDTGPGIPDNEQPKIFTDFYRVASQRSIKGLGLGLAVADRMASFLGHELRVHSVLHKGSHFSIAVPQCKIPVIANNPEQVNNTGDIKGLKIMYVDDGEENIGATERLLRRWDCEMIGFNTPEQALAHSQSNPAPDVLIMDYQLNHDTYDGLSLAKELNESWDKSVPVCIVSAAAEPELKSMASALGFKFLSKPVKPAKLRAILNHFSSRRSRT